MGVRVFESHQADKMIQTPWMGTAVGDMSTSFGLKDSTGRSIRWTRTYKVPS